MFTFSLSQVYNSVQVLALTLTLHSLIYDIGLHSYLLIESSMYCTGVGSYVRYVFYRLEFLHSLTHGYSVQELILILTLTIESPIYYTGLVNQG